MTIIKNILEAIWVIMNEGSIYILFGFLLSGIIHVLLPGNKISEFIGKKSIKGILKSILLGTPMPICSCGVIPAALTLKNNNVNDSATAAFLVSAPSTGIDSIAVSYGFLDLPLTIIKPISAVITAFVTGIFVKIFGEKENKKTSTISESPKCHCEIEDTNEERTKRKPLVIIRNIISYGFREMLSDVAFSMTIGIILAAVVGTIVIDILPETFLNLISANSIGSMIMMLIIGLPIYVCATSSMPLAASFLFAGFTPGSVLVFLIAGPSTNFSTIAVILQKFGKRFLIIYLSSITLVSLVLGYFTNIIYFNILNIKPISILNDAVKSTSETSIILQIFAVILTLLLIYGIFKNNIYNKVKKNRTI